MFDGGWPWGNGARQADGGQERRAGPGSPRCPRSTVPVAAHLTDRRRAGTRTLRVLTMLVPAATSRSRWRPSPGVPFYRRSVAGRLCWFLPFRTSLTATNPNPADDVTGAE